jgi:hypothetical protein
LEILERLEGFSVGHIAQVEKAKANMLAQQASGYNVKRGRFRVVQGSATNASIDAHEASGESGGKSDGVADD